MVAVLRSSYRTLSPPRSSGRKKRMRAMMRGIPCGLLNLNKAVLAVAAHTDAASRWWMPFRGDPSKVLR